MFEECLSIWTLEGKRSRYSVADAEFKTAFSDTCLPRVRKIGNAQLPRSLIAKIMAPIRPPCVGDCNKKDWNLGLARHCKSLAPLARLQNSAATTSGCRASRGWVWLVRALGRQGDRKDSHLKSWSLPGPGANFFPSSPPTSQARRSYFSRLPASLPSPLEFGIPISTPFFSFQSHL